jgi:CubicO group peptidase (beta-lactamase class C family)
MDPATKEMMEQFIGPNSLLGRTLSVNGALAEPGAFNRPELHAAELPAANGITNARSLAGMYNGVIGGLLTPAQIDLARTLQTEGEDRCLFFKTTFGLGFFISSEFAPYGSPGSFGHAGAGGSVGFGDPENQLAFGYVMNKMAQNLSGDPRTRGLVQACYDAIGVEPKFV